MRRAPARIVTPAAVVVGLAVVALAASWIALQLDTRRVVYTDSASIREPADSAQVRDILWEPARLVEDSLNTGEDEYEPRITLDGRTMFFVRGQPGTNADIYYSERTVDGWTTPEPIDAINSEYDELGPSPTRHGDALFFYSNREGGLGGYDVWVVRRTDDGWRDPINLGPAVNSPFNDYGPALSPDDTTLYFASNRPPPDELDPDVDDAWSATIREDLFQRHYDIYRSTVTEDGAQDAQPVDAINTEANEGSPAISPFGDFLYFSSDRAGGHGRFDLYRSRIIEGEPREVENLGGAVNSQANELDPALSMGGFELHFSSDRPFDRIEPSRPNPYNLYASTSREVFRDVEVVESNIDWPALLTNLLWLLLLLLLLALLYLLFRRFRTDDRFKKLSLLAKCILASILAHMLLMTLFAFWMIGTSIGDAWRRAGGTRVVIASSASSDSVGQQVRGGLTAVDVSVRPAAPAESPPLEVNVTPLMQMANLEALRQEEAAPSQLQQTDTAEDSEIETPVAAPEFVRAETPDVESQEAAPDEVQQTSAAELAQDAPSVETLDPTQAPTRLESAAQVAEFESDVEPQVLSEPEAVVEAQSTDAAMADQVAPPDFTPPAVAAETPLETASPAESAQVRSAEATLEPVVEPADSSARPTDSLDFDPLATTIAVSPQQAPTAAPELIDPLADDQPRDAAADAAPPVRVQTDASLSRAGAMIPDEDLHDAVTPSDSRATATREIDQQIRSRSATAAPAPASANDDTRFAAPSVSLTPAEREASAVAPAASLSQIQPEDATPVETPTITDASPSSALAVVDAEMAAAPSPNDSATTRNDEPTTQTPVRAAISNQRRIDAPATDTDAIEEVSVSPLAQTSSPTPLALQAPNESADDAPVAHDIAPPSVATGSVSVDAIESDLAMDLPTDTAMASAEESFDVLPTPRAQPAPAQTADLRDLASPVAAGAAEVAPAEMEPSPMTPSRVADALDTSDSTPSTVDLAGAPSELALDIPPAPAFESVFREEATTAHASETTTIVEADVARPRGDSASTPLVDLSDTAPAPYAALTPLSPAPDSPDQQPALLDRLEDASPTLATTMTLTPSPTRAETPSFVPDTFSIPTELGPPNDAYAQRSEESREELVEALGGSEETERAVALALDWLARHQSEDGRWDSDDFDDGCGECDGSTSITSDVALTGLSLLCFLAADHTHIKQGPYQDNVQRGLEFLLSRVGRDGDLRSGETMYSHGIASIALAEAYGMTRDDMLREPVERVMEFIINARNRERGGWRYAPRQMGDTSVLGWQVMALTSARRAGLRIPDAIFQVADDWLDIVDTPSRPGLYAYQPGQPPTVSMTAEAMFVSQLINARRLGAPTDRAIEFILGETPDWEARSNTYFWYYATLALFQQGGDAWEQWNQALSRELIEHQRDDGLLAGSWDPQDRWSQIGGRVYQTAICTLSLEVYYRYLPLYATPDDERRTRR